MKQKLRYMTLALACIPSLAAAADVGVDATTLIRLEERSISGLKDETVVPATQFLGVDLDKLGDGNLSFHLYGWGRADLADKSTEGGSTDGDLSYAYLAYRLPQADGQLKLGRFYVFEGIAAEHVDGVSARTDLGAGFNVSAFGGAPVRLNMTDRNKGDYVLGGRLGFRVPGILEIGAAAVREGNVDTGPATDLKDYRQLVGGDVWLAPFKAVELRGRSSYNTATEGFAEHSYLLLVQPHKAFSVSAEYNDYRLRDYLATSNLRSLFNPDRDDKLRSYGASVTWTVAKPVEVSADYKRIDYDRAERGNTDRFGGDVRLTLADRKVRTGVAYHRADSDTAGVNSYHEVRGWGLYDATKYFTSVDAIGHFYDNSIDTKDTAFELIGSLGYRIVPSLALSGDISYGENPRMDSELRGVVRLSWNFTHTTKGAAK